MRARTHCATFGAFLAVLGFASSLAGQQPREPAAKGDEAALHDLSSLTPFQRAVYLSDRRAMEWLWRANRPDGLFHPGFNPALNLAVEGDSFVTQCEAATALARAARFSGQAKYTARARQAVLALLAGTKTDPNEAGVRFPVEPSQRLGAAAFLMCAIAELPEPGPELLDQGEQLGQYLRKQQQADGSFRGP